MKWKPGWICLFLILLLNTGQAGFSQPALEKVSLLDNSIELLVPVGFKPMPPEMVALKYPSPASPDWIITNPGATVNLLYKYTTSIADDNQVPEFTDKLLASLRVTQQGFELADDGILLQDGKNIGYIKFITQARDQRVYNLFFYISVKDRILLFSFNCTEALRSTWEATADKIAASTRVKPAL